VDEQTLARLGRWPLKRRHYASLLERLDPSTVVGFDIIMAEPTADDALLARAMARQGRVILPSYFAANASRIDPSPDLAPRARAHIHVEPDVDNVVRGLHHLMASPRGELPSLSLAMLQSAGSAPPLPPLPATTTGLAQGEQRRINFYGPPGTFRRIPLVEIIQGRHPASTFRNTFLLVGLTAPGIVDQIATPFSQHRNLMPGIEVQASALQNLLEGSSIRQTPDLVRWGTALLLALTFGLALAMMHESTALLSALAVLGLILALTLALFALSNLWLGPSLFLATCLGTTLTSYLFRLDRAARSLDDKHAALCRHLGSPNDTASCRVGGLAGYLTEGGIDARVQRLLRLEQRYEDSLEETVQERTRQLSEALKLLDHASNEMILRLTRAVESRDEGTGEHIVRVGLYARELARQLDMTPEFVELITFASAMHDIGKIGIPDHVLLNPGRYTPEEMTIMEAHCAIGARILADSSYPKLQMSAVIALNHHERWDGRGYPSGLAGEDIPLEARIFSICDCYDALRSQRFYKPPLDHDTTCRMILTQEEGHFDPRILETFRDLAPTFARIYDSWPGDATPLHSPF
jgi:CHASE2 domain-containing sensor protein